MKLKLMLLVCLAIVTVPIVAQRRGRNCRLSGGPVLGKNDVP